MRRLLACIALLVGFELSSATARAEDPAGAASTPAQTGHFSAAMEERAALSPIRIVCGRLGWDFDRVKLEKQEHDYEVAKETLEGYVPASYDGTEAYGLITWVSAGGNGRPPAHYLPILDKHKLIWVGANNDGNSRAVWCRMGVAIDATHHMMKRYKIDPDKVFVSGASGGGRTSSMMAIAFPDLYRGGIYIIGMNHYRTLPASNDPGKFWSATYARPGGNLLRLAQLRSVHVALEGDGDINRFQAKAVCDSYVKEGYKYVTYIEAPGVGHSSPSAEWFDKAVTALLDPIESGAVARTAPKLPAAATPARATAAGAGSAAPGETAAPPDLAAARELAKKDPVAGYEALQAYIRSHAKAPETVEALTMSEALLKDPKTKKAIEDRAEADKLLRVSKVYIQNRLYGQARSRLQTAVATYPGTPAAEEAKKLLKEVGEK